MREAQAGEGEAEERAAEGGRVGAEEGDVGEPGEGVEVGDGEAGDAEGEGVGRGHGGRCVSSGGRWRCGCSFERGRGLGMKCVRVGIKEAVWVDGIPGSCTYAIVLVCSWSLAHLRTAPAWTKGSDALSL